MVLLPLQLQLQVAAAAAAAAAVPLPLPPLRIHAPVHHCDITSWNDVINDLIDVGVCLLDLKAVSLPVASIACDHNALLTHRGDALSLDESSPSSSVIRNVTTDTTNNGIPHRAFQSAIEVFDRLRLGQSSSDQLCACVASEEDPGDLLPVPTLDETSDSAHATGYHRAGAMSARYNAHREGLVFSNGEQITLPSYPLFTSHCDTLFQLLHSTADQVLQAMDRYFDIQESSDPSIKAATSMPTKNSESNWFQSALGPTVQNSQWHIKRYVCVSPESSADHVSCTNHDTKRAGSCIEHSTLLPTHTDPSLLSVVILDQPGTQSGALGLQYFNPMDQSWTEVPFSGHNVAIVLVGSVLQHITGGYMKACKHRVETMDPSTAEPYNNNRLQRIAATLFVRPAPRAMLSMIPSTTFNDRTCRKLTFAQWNAKTARKYGKAKQSTAHQ